MWQITEDPCNARIPWNAKSWQSRTILVAKSSWLCHFFSNFRTKSLSWSIKVRFFTLLQILLHPSYHFDGVLGILGVWKLYITPKWPIYGTHNQILQVEVGQIIQCIPSVLKRVMKLNSISQCAWEPYDPQYF